MLIICTSVVLVSDCWACGLVAFEQISSLSKVFAYLVFAALIIIKIVLLVLLISWRVRTEPKIEIVSFGGTTTSND